jgi:cytosine/adenosine deaminase-related metal-dependent hydrolase
MPGAKADIITGLDRRRTPRMGPVRDPIKSLIDCGIGNDVDTVIVDGVVRVENGRILASILRNCGRSAGGR